MFSFFGCYFRGESANLAFSPEVDFGCGCKKSLLQHGGFGCLGRLNTQVMKCLFMVMSLNPAPLISTADFTCLRQAQMELDSEWACYLLSAEMMEVCMHIQFVKTDQSTMFARASVLSWFIRMFLLKNSTYYLAL